jgi:hypothetical protein
MVSLAISMGILSVAGNFIRRAAVPCSAYHTTTGGTGPSRISPIATRAGSRNMRRLSLEYAPPPFADRVAPSARGPLGMIVAMSGVIFIFLCLRFFGQGCLALVSRVAIGKWFERYRGRATAVAGIFTAFGFNSSPMLLNHLSPPTAGAKPASSSPPPSAAACRR